MKYFFFLLLSSYCFSQNFNWITPNKLYLKLFIIEDGVYRINKNDFTQSGINVNFDPRTIKVYNRGTQLPVYFEGEQDGVFDNEDYLDFYATRNYGGLTKTYFENNGILNVHYITDEYYNNYSDTNVYWIGWDGEFGQRYTVTNNSSSISINQNFFFQNVHLEYDNLYSLGETINPNSDFRYFNNEKISGEGWFWTQLFNNQVVNDTFRTINLATIPQTCSLRLFAYPNARDTSFDEHKLVLKINSTVISTLSRNDYDRFDTIINFSSSLLSSNNINNISAVYTPTFTNSNITPNIYFDLFEIQYPRNLKFENSKLHFNFEGNDTSSKLIKITGFNPGNPINIYDIKNNIKIVNFSSDFDTLTFTGKSNSTFEVINSTILKHPFRIISRQVPNLVSNTNGADYMIIYNTQFENQAELLRSHRETYDNFRSLKCRLDDVIDIFGFGIEEPIGIKNFVTYVYNNWQLPKIKYICLFGRGSLDPKNNKKITNNYYPSLFPVYGNPQSDGYYVNTNYGGFTYYQKIAIGRLPVLTVQEAQETVNKIINYDYNQPDNWWKTYLMITGGSNPGQQQQYQLQSNIFINNYIYTPPISGDAHKIYRNDSAGGITFNYKDSILNEFDRGSLIVNFIGHAANQDWEVGLEDPNTLQNGNLLPLTLSMTCFTGKNSEPNFRGFGEKFITLPNKGAIGFIGSTGWSFSSSGNILNGYLFEAFANDTIRRIGDILKYSTLKLANDSISFTSKNTLNCYNLLGDPATKLLLPIYPEFIITNGDYKLSNPYPIIGENVNLIIFPRNLGLFADQCLIRFEIFKNSQLYKFKDTIITNFSFKQEANYLFKIDSMSNYFVKVTLDYDNRFPQEDPNNNVIQFYLPIRNVSYSPLKPINNSILNIDTVEFVGLNPQINPIGNNIKILLQLDTNKNFINPIQTLFSTNISGVVTKFFYKLNNPDSNKIYYWRTNSVVNSDSSGWSPVQKFIYNPGITFSRMSRASYDSSTTIYYKYPGQFNTNEIKNVYYNNSGFELNKFQGNLLSKSYGSNSYQASYFLINSYQIYADGGQNTGLNLAKVSKYTGRLIQFKNFRMSTASSSDSVLIFLNSYDTTQYLMVFIAALVSPSDSLRMNTKIKFKQFGSRYVDFITRFDEFDTWSFIGYLGADTSFTSEEFHNYPTTGCPESWCSSQSQITPLFQNTSGSIIFNIGPAHRWKNFSWDRLIYPNTSLTFNLSGIGRNNDTILLITNINSNNYTNIDTINNYSYPNMYLTANFSIDTLSSNISPLFKFLNFKYTPPAEIIPDNYSFVKSDSIVPEGQNVTISVRNYNVGYVPANVILNKWSVSSPTGNRIVKLDTITTPLKPDSSKLFSASFSTAGLKANNKLFDTILVYFETSILGNENDFYPYNNIAITSIIVYGDTTQPLIDVTYDGQKILNGDLIQSKPEIIYTFSDVSTSSYELSDTSSIFIKLDNSLVHYYIGSTINPLIEFLPVNNGNEKIKIKFHPELQAGEHKLQYIGKDKKGNYADTVTHLVNISKDFVVKNLINYPNPMINDTYITFILYAEKNPASCKIKIYTVAGRLIKEIDENARVGFNEIHWDGKDNDGETIANGIYFYKLILEDNGKLETSIEKIAVLK